MPTILIVFSFVFLVLAAFGVGAPRVALGWLGLACYVLAGLVGRS